MYADHLIEFCPHGLKVLHKAHLCHKKVSRLLLKVNFVTTFPINFKTEIQV